MGGGRPADDQLTTEAAAAGAVVAGGGEHISAKGLLRPLVRNGLEGAYAAGCDCKRAQVVLGGAAVAGGVALSWWVAELDVCGLCGESCRGLSLCMVLCCCDHFAALCTVSAVACTCSVECC